MGFFSRQHLSSDVLPRWKTSHSSALSWDSKGCSASGRNPQLLLNQEVCYCWKQPAIRPCSETWIHAIHLILILIDCVSQEAAIQISRQKFYTNFSFLPTVLHVPPSHPCWIYYPNRIWSSSLLCNFLQPSVTSSPLVTNVFSSMHWPNPSSRTMALGSTQLLIAVSSRNLPGGRGQPACKADNLIAVCELIV
jgi:hypothetical protein